MDDAANRRIGELARQLGLDPVALGKGTRAAMSAMGAASSFDQALAVAGAVLAASGLHAPPF